MEQLSMDTSVSEVKDVATKEPVTKESTAKEVATGNTEANKHIENEVEEVESSEPHVYTVSEINQAIRSELEGQFPQLWVQGEISNFKAHSSGHWYFSLKDKKAQVNAVMFRGFNGRLKFRPEDGMEVLVRGRITVYEPRGTYQVFCELMEPVGAGALQKAYEQLKAKLEKEGLFEVSRKRPLPAYPQHLAIVTSPTGAAIRDMLNVLGRRFRGLRITLIPALVQGDAAPASIVQGIQSANCLSDVDVLIVGRGGGSIEDLWAFNDEGVARAMAASRVPVISAVGHEVDFTIADFVADLRAPTPSAAAELVVKSTEDLKVQLRQSLLRLQKNWLYKMEVWKKLVAHHQKCLVDPRRRLQDLIQRCDELTQRLEAAAARGVERRKLQVAVLLGRMVSPKELLHSLRRQNQQLQERLRLQVRNSIKEKRAQLREYASLLDSLSPLRVVERGFSIVTTKNSKVVKSFRQLQVNEVVDIRWAEGRGQARIESLNENKEI